MGMFDYSDPEIALAAGLLSGRGNLGGIMGRSLMDAQRAYLATSEDKRRNKQSDLQAQQYQLLLDEAQQKKKQQALLDQFRASIPAPTALGNVDWKSGQMGPTNDRVSQVGQIDPLQLLMHGAMKSGALSPIDYIKAQQKDDALTTVPAGATVLKGGKPIFSNPKEDAVDPFVRLLKQAGIDPASPQGQALLTQRLQKESSHQPPAQQINYGSSTTPVLNPDGTIGLLQLGNTAGAPPKVVVHPGTGKPAVQPPSASAGREKDLTDSQAKATTFLGQMRSSTDALRKLGMDQSALSLQAETALAGGPANVAITAKAQQVRQTQDQWSEAYLRFKTGAATTKDEVAANRKTFFPVIGDKPETVALKAQMRAQAEKDLEIAAGRGTAQLNSRDPAPAASAPSGFRIIKKN
jgi:hypothetical protein